MVKITMETEVNGLLSFLGMQLLNRAPQIETKVYITPANTSLLLHYQRHVEMRCKRGLLRTMLDRAYRAVFPWLKYPQHLIDNTVRYFVASKAEDPQQIPAPRDSPTVRIVLPFKDQALADLVHKQLKDLSQKIDTVIQLTFVSNKIQQELKIQERKPPIVNQHCVVYKFQCDLCDVSYVGYTLRHLHQRVVKHKNQSSSIGKHLLNKHRKDPKDLDRYFSVLKKCMNKFDLVYKTLLIRELTPSLNVQSDSIQAKVFALHYIFRYYVNFGELF